MLRTRLIAGATSGFVLSAVFATVLTLANFGETFFEAWRVDPTRPAPITLRLPRSTIRTLDVDSGEHSVSDTAPAPRGGAVSDTAPAPRGGAVTAAHMIHRGEIARDPAIAALARAYERDRRPPRASHLLASWLVQFIISMMMTTYLRRGSARLGRLLRTQVGLVSLALLFLVAAKVFLLFTHMSMHLLPVALVPLWASLYLDRRTGMLMSGVMALLCGSLVSYDPIACATYFTGSAAGAAYLTDSKHSARLIGAGLLAGIASAVVYVTAKEIFDGFSLRELLYAHLHAGPPSALGSGIAAGLLAFTLQPVVSRLLGVLSRGQLLNLTDLDQPLLRKMAAEAPGSWEHSRAMANLAEAAAASIHADALLTRTGAYYHDLGKSSQAKYYVENLEPGERSPHEELEPEVSADAIMAHVIEGVRILREGNIPEPVVEFVYTHHGTSVIEYFWHKCLKQGNPKGLTDKAFRYPGMVPRTKETAILMLIDSIEAGARTVEPPTREVFEQLVQRVIFTKLKQGQLDESGLTLQDVHVLSNQIAETLVSVRHNRIRYPWQDEQAQAAGPGAAFEQPRATPTDQAQDRISPALPANGADDALAKDAARPDEPPR